jgi:subtilisin family serine protease
MRRRSLRPLVPFLSLVAALPLLVAAPVAASVDTPGAPASASAEASTIGVQILARFTVEVPGQDPGWDLDMPGEPAGIGAWRVFHVRDGETPEEALTRVEQDSRVELAQIAHPFRAASTSAPNDPFFPQQWHLHQIGLPDAWAWNTGKGAVVAVVDSGVRVGPDLSCKPLAGEYDATTMSGSTGSGAAKDNTGHGTHVAGTVAQCTNNGHGAAGVAPGASILAVKVMDGDEGDFTAVYRGIVWAVDNGASVINLSLGCDAGVGMCGEFFLDEAIAHAVSNDVLLVAAAGNKNKSSIDYPASHPDVMGIAATTSSGARASYSNRGSNLSVAAPGGEAGGDPVIQETFDKNGTFGMFGMVGTSMATPHVAGLAALLRAGDPKASAKTVRKVIEDTAKDLGPTGFDSSFGHGEIRAVAALTKLLGPIKTSSDPIDFVDVSKDSIFYDDIQWLAQKGITKGCNPPTNDRFCPTSIVTREQMAAFMVRALGLTKTSSDGVFTDVPAGSTFEKDINRLATAGITRGCNPPANDRFCPTDQVTREQMAAFMVRALGLTKTSSDGVFTDVPAGSTFEKDINRLATAGITRGCNPPANDRFCPTNPVTREQMAAFMRRGF